MSVTLYKLTPVCHEPPGSKYTEDDPEFDTAVL